MHRFESIIFWRNEGEAFVADVPALPGCKTHGGSQPEALDNGEEAVELKRRLAWALGSGLVSCI